MRRPPTQIDIAAALLVCGSMIGTARIPVEHPGERPIDGWVFVISSVCALAVLLTRRFPYAAAPVVVVALGTYSALGYPAGPAYLAGPLTLTLTGLVLDWRRTSLAAVAFVTAILGGRLLAGGEPSSTQTAVVVGWALVAVLASEVARGRLERLAERRRLAVQGEERARVEQRLRIAQDLHDGLAHALSVIAIQSRVAAREMPEGRGAQALRAIDATTAQALADLGTMVSGLRDGGAPRHPVGTLDHLQGMLEQARAAGQVVELHRHSVDDGDDQEVEPHVAGAAGLGGPGLPASVSSAAYRLVQEALTNARRHAPSAPVRVDIEHGHGLTVRVTNEPAATRQPHPSGTGLGLVGITERVAATGGTSSAGPTGEGGWEVSARWPHPSES